MEGGILKGKVALVTGGSGGIGRAICKQMANEGAKVIIHYCQNADSAEKLSKEIDGSFIVGADLRNSDEVTGMFNYINKIKGEKIDILVNGAGMSHSSLFTMTNESKFDEIIDINLKSVYFCCKKFIMQCLRYHIGGVITNISSCSSLGGKVGMSIYGAAKAGINSLTRTLAREYAANGIRVNAVSPGPVRTRMMENIGEDIYKKILSEVPLNRIADPTEIAYPVVFLSSELSSYITGAVLPVDGGQTA